MIIHDLSGIWFIETSRVTFGFLIWGKLRIFVSFLQALLPYTLCYSSKNTFIVTICYLVPIRFTWFCQEQNILGPGETRILELWRYCRVFCTQNQATNTGCPENIARPLYMHRSNILFLRFPMNKVAAAI